MFQFRLTIPINIMKVSLWAEWAYRSEVFIRVARTTLGLFLFHSLWAAIYGGATDHDQVVQAFSFSLFGGVQQFFNLRNPDRLGERVSDGGVIFLFARPMTPFRFFMWQEFGRVLLSAATVVLVFLLAAWSGIVHGAPWTMQVVFAVSALVGMSAMVFVDQLIELPAIWLMSSRGLRSFGPFVAGFLSGGVIPLYLCPHWFAAIAHVLPFQAMVNLPVEVYLNGSGSLAALAQEFAWAAGLGLLACWVWRRAARHVEVQGA